MQSRLGNKRELVNRAAGSTAIVPPGAKPGPAPWRGWDGRPGHPELAARRHPCLRPSSWRAEARGAEPGAVLPGPVPCQRGGFGATAGWRGARRPRGAGADGGSPAMPAPRLPQRSCAGASAMGATSSAQPCPPCCHLRPPAGGPAVGPPAPPSSAPWEAGCCRGARGLGAGWPLHPLGTARSPCVCSPEPGGTGTAQSLPVAVALSPAGPRHPQLSPPDRTGSDFLVPRDLDTSGTQQSPVPWGWCPRARLNPAGTWQPLGVPGGPHGCGGRGQGHLPRGAQRWHSVPPLRDVPSSSPGATPASPLCGPGPSAPKSSWPRR